MLRCTVVFLAFIVIPIFTNVKSEKSLEIEFLEEYFKNEIDRYYIHSFLCWNRDDVYALVTALSSKNYRITVFNIKSENVHDILPIHNGLYLLDYGCENSDQILTEAKKQNLFQHPRKWLVLSTKNISENLHDLNIFADSSFTMAQQIDDSSFELQEVYFLNNTGMDIMIYNVSKWTTNVGFIEPRTSHSLETRKNLRGSMLRTSIVLLHNETLNHLTDYRDIHVDALSKHNYILLNILKDYLNSTRTFTFVYDWGSKQNNGSYTGMIGTLERNEADIAGTPMFVMPERLSLLEFVAMTTPTRTTFVFRQPPLSYVSNVFTLPFTTSVWICSFALLILVTALQYLTVHCEWRLLDISPTEMTLKDSVSESVMVTVGSICQQGAPDEPKSFSAKIVFLFSLISLMFLYTSYSANIVALLQSSANNIQTLEDLLESRLELGVENTVYNRYYFEHATEPLRKKIYERKVAPPGHKPHFMTLQEGIERLHQGFFAFHVEQAVAYVMVSEKFLESDKCGLQEIPGYIQALEPWLAVRKNSTYKKLIKLGLRKIHESGILSRELKKLYTTKPECRTGGSSFVSVGLLDCYGAFELLGAGIALSLAAFVFEKFLYNYYHFVPKRN